MFKRGQRTVSDRWLGFLAATFAKKKQPRNPVQHAQLLKKRTEGVRKTWKDRFFVLYDSEFYYFKSSDSAEIGKEHFRLDARKLTMRVTERKDGPGAYLDCEYTEESGRKIQIQLVANSMRDATTWVERLRESNEFDRKLETSGGATGPSSTAGFVSRAPNRAEGFVPIPDVASPVRSNTMGTTTVETPAFDLTRRDLTENSPFASNTSPVTAAMTPSMMSENRNATANVDEAKRELAFADSMSPPAGVNENRVSTPVLTPRGTLLQLPQGELFVHISFSFFEEAGFLIFLYVQSYSSGLSFSSPSKPPNRPPNLALFET